MNNYDQAGGSAWKYDVDKNNTLNNGNSLHVEVESSGTEFWTLQMRTEPLVAKGRKYSIKMKLKASKDIQFEIRVEWTIEPHGIHLFESRRSKGILHTDR